MFRDQIDTLICHLDVGLGLRSGVEVTMLGLFDLYPLHELS